MFKYLIPTAPLPLQYRIIYTFIVSEWKIFANVEHYNKDTFDNLITNGHSFVF